jgi:hypothetical protein
MASSNLHRSRVATSLTLLIVILVAASSAFGQQVVQGFAVERFYPAAPGSSWFVMDDLNISGGLGGAISGIVGYARKPLDLTSLDGTQHLTLVSNEAFFNVGFSVTYDRYRVYMNFPAPFVVTGNSGTLGNYQFNAPTLSGGTNPDTIADPRLGFDVRLMGKPGEKFRLGAGAQIIFPSGDRTDFVSDARYRGMARLLTAGDTAKYSYASQVGIHIRTLNDAPAPGSPSGHEFLFGGSVGRKFPIGGNWSGLVGPELWGATAFNSFFEAEHTALEGIVTTRIVREGNAPHVQFKIGVGHGIVQNFGTPTWRVLVGVELFGHRPGPHN